MDRELIMDKLNREYRLGLYEKSMPSTLTWVEKLTIAKKSGFDYLEISIDESDAKLARLDQPTNEIKEAIQKTGVPISSMCLSGHRKYPLGSHDKEIQKKSLEIMKKAIDFAADLGVRIIQLAGYDVYYETGDLYTNHDFETNLKKCVEIGNLKNASLLYGVDVDEDLMCGKGHIFASHLKETVPGKYREIPFGTGHTEFVKNIKTLKRLGVRMFVGEFWYVNNEDWQDVVKDAGVFLRDKLDKGFE